MDDRRALRGLPLAGMAMAGVVLGHWLGYGLAVPDPHLRDEILAQSGHGYWILAIKAAVVLGFVSLGTVLIRHLSGRLRGEHPEGDRPASLAARLAVVQITSFVALEVTERIAAGDPIAWMFHHHIFLLGIALQVVVAGAGALLLWWCGRVAARVAEALVAPSFQRLAAVHRFAVQAAAQPPQVLRGGPGLRGPPSR